MAAGDLNRWTAIGRLTRDPEEKTFQNGGGVVNFGFATTGKAKKNVTTGEWENEPVFVDCKAFISAPDANGKKLGRIVKDYAAKGSRLYIEGHIVLEKWIDKQSNQERSKLVVEIDQVILLDKKGDVPVAQALAGGTAFDGDAGGYVPDEAELPF